MTTVQTGSPDTGSPEGQSTGHVHVNKNLALVVLAIAQLMVVLDATIVNVALPDIAKALHVRSNADLQWVVTGYTLTFGGFLLLGGKLADRLGRKKVFMAGALLFAAASLTGGLAGSLGVLLTARGVQGMGGALMSPAALSLITVIFDEGKERNRAFGIYAAITAGVAAVGLILGGVLTQYASWRWVFFVNLPIAAVAILGAIRFVPDSKDEKAKGFDIPGAVLVTAGLMSLVFALVKGNQYGWSSGRTIGTLVLALALLAAFAGVQTRASEPLVPFRVFHNKSVLGADIGSLLVGAGIFAIFFFLILWMQVVNGYSPVTSGLAFLPMTFLIGASAGIGSQLLGRIGPRPLLTVGPDTGRDRPAQPRAAAHSDLVVRRDGAPVPRARRLRDGHDLRVVDQLGGRRCAEGGCRYRLCAAQRGPAGRRRARPGRAYRRQHRPHHAPAQRRGGPTVLRLPRRRVGLRVRRRRAAAAHGRRRDALVGARQQARGRRRTEERRAGRLTPAGYPLTV